MKVLVTGVKGQLGHDLIPQLQQAGHQAIGTDIEDFDLTDGAAVMRYVKACAPDAIIHCAAYTAVDKAETEPEKCCLINGSGTMNLALAARAVDAKMAYISTDYVFDGSGTEPHQIREKPRPLNVYGLSKLQGEEAVQSLLTKHFIVRTSWVFGLNGKNFVRTMLRLGKERSEIGVVCDQVGSPTYTQDLAALLVRMIATERYGLYHATNEGFCSWAEFAQRIMMMGGCTCRIRPILTANYPTPAVRPLNSRLDKSCLTAAGFTHLPVWQSALERYIDELMQAGEL